MEELEDPGAFRFAPDFGGGGRTRRGSRECEEYDEPALPDVAAVELEFPDRDEWEDLAGGGGGGRAGGAWPSTDEAGFKRAETSME